ncbi:MAG: terminase large subunit [bacterium]
MTKEEYIKYCNDIASEYENDVINDSIIVSKWIKKSVIREKELRNQYQYRQDKVDDVYKFLYYINIEKGKRFYPLSFQSWIIKCIYGLYIDENRRLRKYGTIWMSRKNGKTAFSSVLSLYNLTKEQDEGEVYFCATTSKQASQALKYLKSYISYSKALKKRVKVKLYELLYKNSIAKALPGLAEKLDGLNPSFAIIDESHAHKTRDLYNVIETGTGSRTNSLILEISTAGYNKDYPFFEQLENGKKILNGEINQDNHFLSYFTLDNESEIDNPEMWIKSNPSMGTIINKDDLVDKYNKAKKIQTDFDSFIIKQLNYYKDIKDNWITDNILKKCFNKDFNIEILKGNKAYLAVDLSATRDLSSLSIVVEKDGKLYNRTEFYYPDSEYNKIRRNGINLDKWIEQGYIINTQKRTIDYDYIYNRIMYYNDIFDIQVVGYDKWNSAMLIPKVELEGILCNNCPQNTGFFNAPLKYLEKAIYENFIKMEFNPVLRWNYRNVILYRDGNDNIKIMKNKSLDAVDGVVSLAMAIGQYLELSTDDLYYKELYK